MTPEQFCYWLQGYFELKRTIDHRLGATQETMEVIEEHLQTVFKKVTPVHLPQVGMPVKYEDICKTVQCDTTKITC